MAILLENGNGDEVMINQALGVESLPEPAERRRSQRIPSVAPVKVAWHTQDGTFAKEQAETEDISEHGALLRMKHGFLVREVVVLSRDRATDWTMARVMRCGPPRPEGWIPVAVELAVPSQTFWGALSWSGM